MKIRQKLVMFFATGCCIGYIPFASGTFGTIPGLVLCFILSLYDIKIAALCAILLIVLAVWISDNAKKLLNQEDPGCIVIDEIAGMIVTLIGLPFTFISAAAGFFLFRFLDILKPFPIRYIEKKVKGGAGIVLDDVAAGIIGNIILRLLFLWVPYELS